MALEFSESARKEIEEIRSRYPNSLAALLPVLHLAQREFEWLSDEALELVGTTLDVPPVKVRQVATFYTMYNLKPVGRFHVQVCTNVACYLCGGPEILEHLERKLGIKAGETTKDELFTLTEVECLAACGTAPAIQIDDTKDPEWPIRYREGLTREKVDALLDEMRAAGAEGKTLPGEPL